MIIKPYSAIAQDAFDPADYPALAHYFPFNEESGATVTDVAGGLVLTDASSISVSQSEDGHIVLGATKNVIQSGIVKSPGAKKIIMLSVHRGASVLLRLGSITAGTNFGIQLASAVAANSVTKVADGATLFSSTDGLDGNPAQNQVRCSIIDLGTDGTGGTYGLSAFDFDGTTWTARAAVSLATSAASIDAIEQLASMSAPGNPFVTQVWYFDTVPTDFKAATLWTFAKAVDGVKAPYPGWKGRT